MESSDISINERIHDHAAGFRVSDTSNANSSQPCNYFVCQADPEPRQSHHDDDKHGGQTSDESAKLGEALLTDRCQGLDQGEQCEHSGAQPAQVCDNKSINSEKFTEKFFDDVRRMCEGVNNDSEGLCPDPLMLAPHRRENWPRSCNLPEEVARIYRDVRNSGVPNAIGLRRQLPTKLNIEAWDSIFGSDKKHAEMLAFVKYGFPMGYMGPVSHLDQHYNHPSACAYPGHIDRFVAKELDLGGLIGPMDKPPFAPWAHCAPIMSRPKRNSDSRRIISDLTYPYESSINKYILKNGVWGEERQHSLPTIDDAIGRIRDIGPGAYMCSVDIARAYKNFKSDPLDWPLLCLQWQNCYYCDISMPFGSRASSYHMQTIANALVDVLESNGIYARVYLDDLVCVAPSKEKAEKDYRFIKHLLETLGLPEADDKSQSPAPTVDWLGVHIDAPNMRVSIPKEKVDEVLAVVGKYKKKRSSTVKELQSVIGKLVHVAKCVPPARLFVSRLLDGLRNAKGRYININSCMKKDLQWFLDFCRTWNGKAMIQPENPSRKIVVDASLSGVGATDGQYAYAAQLTPIEDGARNICEIEAANVAIALHTFVTHADRGAHIEILCDNLPSVQTLTSGKGRNNVILQIARIVWMLQAELDIKITYSHIPGRHNVVADRLSRAHLSGPDRKHAIDEINHYGLTVIEPCIYSLSLLDNYMCCRSGGPIVTGASSLETTAGMGAWYGGKLHVGRHSLPSLLL